MKIILYLSNLLSVIFVTLLCIFLYLIEGTHITTISLFLALFILIDINISNLYKSTKKYINNALYHTINIVICLYSFYIMINSYFLYFYYKLVGESTYSIYFYDHILIVMLLFVLLYFISFIFKKEVIKKSINNTKTIYIVLSILSVLPILNGNISLSVVISLCLSIFYLFMIFNNRINTKNDLQKTYFILIILSIFTNNLIGLILLIHLYFNLDKVGLNI